MAGVSFMQNGSPAFLDFTPEFEVGSQPPSGYTDWHAWAEKQYKGGLRQAYCGGCGKWLFPQEKCKCNVKRLSKQAFEKMCRESAAMVKKKYPSAETKYRRDVRAARKRGEIE